MAVSQSIAAFLCLVVLHLCQAVEDISTLAPSNGSKSKNSTEIRCKPGTVLAVWMPDENISLGDRTARATVYMVCLIYMFLGISIIADRFMEAIEVITSQEKEVIVKMKNGEKQVVSVRVWNETVSNLTLMALGSSAPEILLSVIEIIGKGFKAGELGPGTIVGSAAFNLFIIIGICVYVIPDGEVRRIKHLSVFFITATWSVFAYVWLYLIIAVISPNQIDVWEAVITFLFFPMTVLSAYFADTKIFFKRFLPSKYGGAKKLEDGDLEMQNQLDPETSGQEPVNEFEKHRLEYIEILKEIRKKNPNIDPRQLEDMAQMEILNAGPKSRAFYRMQATRQMTGSGNVIKKSKVERRQSVESIKENEFDDNVQRVFFDPGHYTVMENVGTFNVTVSRKGGDLNTIMKVDYKTVDGSANAGGDFEHTSGTLTFQPEECHKQFPITIMDDDVFEEDEHFYVHIENARIVDNHNKERSDAAIMLFEPNVATVMILDDDHNGIFHFEEDKVEIHEAVGEANIKVCRSSGARGNVRVPYQTIDGTAKGGGQDYEDAEGFIEFENDEVEKYIKIRIIDDNEYEKSEFFYIELGEPIVMKSEGAALAAANPDDSGAAKLGEVTKIEVQITESIVFKNTVDKLLKKANLSLVIGTSSWKEQFTDAITVSAGDDDGEGDGDSEDKLPSCMDYVMHFLTIFWKILFAFVPPTDYANGWLCFTFSISMIGVLTALIGDLASHFGCTVGLTDAVTSITFVALGTSLPDTFASKTAACGDAYADGSIGNVTGSNAVNVFLGIGLAWSMAAIFWWSKGEVFKVEAGSLGFSVTIYCVLAVLAIIILVMRRGEKVGGELGGNPKFKLGTTLVLFGFWMIYVLLSSLENYNHIEGF